MGVNQVFEQWKRSVDADERSWAADEVKTGAKNIEWDLQDLEKSIEMVQSDSKRFSSITQAELDQRKQFVSDTRQHIQKLSREVSSVPQSGSSVRHNRTVSERAASWTRESKCDQEGAVLATGGGTTTTIFWEVLSTGEGDPSGPLSLHWWPSTVAAGDV